MDDLPAGHPSSPYDIDGTVRQPEPRLRDIETTDDGRDPYDSEPQHPKAPDAEAAPAVDSQPPQSEGELRVRDSGRGSSDVRWAGHLEDVRTRLDGTDARGLATNDGAIDADAEAWTADRRAIHGTIIESLYDKAAGVPNEHKAIVAGGLAGAGKTTVLAGHAGVDRSKYLTINPDDIKEELAKRDLIPRVEGLSPMEASDLVHEESSHIAKQLAIRARADGKNLIWDITMSSKNSTEARIDDLRASGYTRIDGIFVDIPLEISARRADARHRQGQDAYDAGEGLGGRFVPIEVITAQADTEWGSKNRRTFEELKPRFDQWTRFDNGVDDRDPVLIEAGSLDKSKETPI